MRLNCNSRSSLWSCELIAMTSDNGNQCIWTGQESKAGRVRSPAAGYITISPGSEMRVGALESRLS